MKKEKEIEGEEMERRRGREGEGEKERERKSGREGVSASFFSLERHNICFTETSALDATNVEEAFQHMITGIDPAYSRSCYYLLLCTEIYSRMLKNTSLLESNGAMSETVELSSKPEEQKKKKACCR